MQFFLPGLALFLFSILCTYYLAPYATPMVAAILSLVFLSYGVYDHYRLFASEYRLSTWQDGLKVYAPFIMVGAILLFVLYGMMAFFTGGTITVPELSLPLPVPTPQTVLQSVSSAANQLVNATRTAVNQTVNAGRNMANQMVSQNQSNQRNQNAWNQENENENENTIRRLKNRLNYLETI